MGGTVLPLRLPGKKTITSYPSLRAAAGTMRGETGENHEASEIELPDIGPDDSLFAVRVSGDSMDGGKEPIPDGTWAVLRWARGRSLSEFEGRWGSSSTGSPALRLRSTY